MALQPSTLLTIQGTGFEPDSWIDIQVQSAPRIVQTAIADSTGKIETATVLPADLPPGTHTILAIGRTPMASITAWAH